MIDNDDQLPLGDPEQALLNPTRREMYRLMRVILDHLLSGHSRQTACAEVAVPYARMQKWISRGRVADCVHPLYPWFRQEVHRCEGLAEKRLSSIVLKEAKEKGNWKAAMFILTKRYGWSERMREDPILAYEQRVAALAKTRADTAYVKERTKRLQEDGDDVLMERVIDVLNSVQHGDKTDGGKPKLN